MDSRQAVKLGIDSGNMITMAYLDDMTDEQMMHRPHAECNHIKWQLGHLIASENKIISDALPDSMPALPDGFADKYTNETAASDDPAAFDSQDTLLRVYEEQRNGTLAVLEGQSAEDLDKATPESMQAYAPTIGAAFTLVGGHLLMHAGQWAVIRRQLGKPPLF